MRRSILFLMLGLFCTMQAISVVSVYVLHDVDRDMIGHWNEAFVQLVFESVIFTLVIAVGVAVLLELGKRTLHLKGHSPRATLGALLGVGIPILQYPWDWAVRDKLPQLADLGLSLYLILAILAATGVLLRDSFTRTSSSAS